MAVEAAMRSSDAHAEYVHWIRNVFNQKGVVWQTGELGKVDEGGGGTIAKFLAALGKSRLRHAGPYALPLNRSARLTCT
jgi:aspartyl aminopeptidase